MTRRRLDVLLSQMRTALQNHKSSLQEGPPFKPEKTARISSTPRFLSSPHANYVIDPRRAKSDIVKSGSIIFDCECGDDARGVLTVYPDGRLKITCIECGFVDEKRAHRVSLSDSVHGAHQSTTFGDVAGSCPTQELDP